MFRFVFAQSSSKMDVKHKSSRPKRIERRIPPPSVKQMSKAIDKKVQLLTRAKSYFDVSLRWPPYYVITNHCAQSHHVMCLFFPMQSRVVVNGKEITTEDLKTMANSINHLYLCMYSRCIALINSDDNIHKLLNFHSNYVSQKIIFLHSNTLILALYGDWWILLHDLFVSAVKVIWVMISWIQ